MAGERTYTDRDEKAGHEHNVEQYKIKSGGRRVWMCFSMTTFFFLFFFSFLSHYFISVQLVYGGFTSDLLDDFQAVVTGVVPSPRHVPSF